MNIAPPFSLTSFSRALFRNRTADILPLSLWFPSQSHLGQSWLPVDPFLCLPAGDSRVSCHLLTGAVRPVLEAAGYEVHFSLSWEEEPHVSVQDGPLTYPFLLHGYIFPLLLYILVAFGNLTKINHLTQFYTCRQCVLIMSSPSSFQFLLDPSLISPS